MLLALAAMRWSRNRAVIVLCVYAALFAGGITAAKIQTLRVAAPIAPFSQNTIVDGWVMGLASAASGRGRLHQPAAGAVLGVASQILIERNLPGNLSGSDE